MKSRLIIILIISSIFYGCPMDRWYSIRIINNSSKDIWVLPGLEKYGANEYPDTLLPIKKPTLTFINKNDDSYIDASFKWEEIINGLPSDTLSIFYFEADSINTLSWDKIRTKYLILRRDDLSLRDFELINWTLTFD